jgi:hypothetical protein
VRGGDTTIPVRYPLLFQAAILRALIWTGHLEPP